MPNNKLDEKIYDLSIPILIVDDYSSMLRILKSILNQFGLLNVDEANNGQEALQKIKEKQYNIIMSDWNMEPISGMELLREVRGKTPDSTFIMVTAKGEHADVINAKKAGVSNYIVKPFSPEVLKNKLVSILPKLEN